MGAELPPPQQIVCHSHWTMDKTKVCVCACPTYMCVCVCIPVRTWNVSNIPEVYETLLCGSHVSLYVSAQVPEAHYNTRYVCLGL